MCIPMQFSLAENTKYTTSHTLFKIFHCNICFPSAGYNFYVNCKVLVNIQWTKL